MKVKVASSCSLRSRNGKIQPQAQVQAQVQVQPQTQVQAQVQVQVQVPIQIRVRVEGNADFILYRSDGKVVWSAHTSGHPGAFLRFDSTDGSLSVYSGSTSLWSSGLARGATKAQLQADCNLVTSDAHGTVLWSLGTKC